MFYCMKHKLFLKLRQVFETMFNVDRKKRYTDFKVDSRYGIFDKDMKCVLKHRLSALFGITCFFVSRAI